MRQLLSYGTYLRVQGALLALLLMGGCMPADNDATIDEVDSAYATGTPDAGGIAALSLTRYRAKGLTTPPHCPSPDTTGLLLEFLDVGQGDAILLSSDTRRILIDGGPSRGTVAQELSARGIDSLDLVIATHHHADHIAGLPTVLRQVTVTAVLENGMTATTAVYGDFVSALETSGARVLRAEARTITLGEIQTIILPPLASPNNHNEASIGLLVQLGGFKAILTGDAETRTLSHWLGVADIPHVSLIKIGHHGSENGTTAAWTLATAPQLAVVSVGRGNSYRHPHPIALSQWRAVGAEVLRTDELGTIAIRGCHDGTVRR